MSKVFYMLHLFLSITTTIEHSMLEKYEDLIQTWSEIHGIEKSYHRYRFMLSLTGKTSAFEETKFDGDYQLIRKMNRELLQKDAKPRRDVNIWLWNPVRNESSWNDIIRRTKQHRRFIKRVIFVSYGVDENGKFGSGGVEWAFRVLARKYAKRFTEFGVEVTGMITAPDTESIVKLIANNTLVENFIHDALVEAQQYGLSGYNIDIERGCSPKYTPLYIDFLQKFANKLHQEGMSLTYDMGGYCAWIEYMQMNCTLMKLIPFDRIFSMDTYTSDLGQWKTYVQTARKELGDVYGAGIMSKTSVLLSKDTLDFAISEGVQALSLWSNPPFHEKYWEGLKYFAYRK